MTTKAHVQDGHDIRALRKDYDAERKRVDTLIANLVGRGT